MAKRRGRPKVVAGPEARIAVAVLAAVNAPVEFVCDELFRLRLSKDEAGNVRRWNGKTVARVFELELKDGRQIATARMGFNLWTKGMGNTAGAASAAQFWLSTKGARSDKDWQKIDSLEITDKLTREIAEGIELGIFSDTELAEIAAGRIGRALFDRLANAPRRTAGASAGGTEAPGAAAAATAKPAA